MAALTISIASSAPVSSSSVRLSHPAALHYSPNSLTLRNPSTPKPKFLKLKISPKNLLFRSLQCYDSTSASTSLQDTENEVQDEEDDEQQEKEVKEATKPPVDLQPSSKLYVGNLPLEMSSSELEELFKKAGRVATAEVIVGRNNRNRGFGFVTMESEEEAQEAIAMLNGHLVGEQALKVNFPEIPFVAVKPDKKPKPKPKLRTRTQVYVDSPWEIYAGNLSWKLTPTELKTAFADQPGVLSAKVCYDKVTRKTRGFGFVSFDSEEAALSALSAMNEVEVEGRPLRLKMAVKRPAPSTPKAEETKSETETDIAIDAPKTEEPKADTDIAIDTVQTVQPVTADVVIDTVQSVQPVNADIAVDVVPSVQPVTAE